MMTSTEMRRRVEYDGLWGEEDYGPKEVRAVAVSVGVSSFSIVWAESTFEAETELIC